MSAEGWTALALVRWTTGYFADHGIESARLDAELLLAHVLGVERIELYTGFDRPVDEAERGRFRALVRDRAKERVPVAYLLGAREFWSQRFKVTRDVLIPRPETELLVRVAVGLAPRRAVEVGVGSGVVCGALAREIEALEMLAIDCSEAALAVASENLEALGVADRVELRRGDGLDELDGRYDLVVSNPPYVPTAELDRLAPELGHEPRVALDGGADGLDVIRRLVAGAPPILDPGGHLALEVGAEQAAAVADLMRDRGARGTRTERDLAGIERVVVAEF